MDALFSFLATPFGWLMRLCYNFVDGILHLPLSYVFTMFLFAIITTLITFWPSLNQQKSSAKMAAIQPFMKEIQKKYPTDRQKQQEKIAQLQKDAGYKASAGCLPTIIMLVLMLAVVQVVYRPLTYMIKLNPDFVQEAGAIVKEIPEYASTSDSLLQNRIIALVQNPEIITEYAGQGEELFTVAEKISAMTESSSGLMKAIGSDLAEEIQNTAQKYSGVAEKFSTLAKKYDSEMTEVRKLNLTIGGANGLQLMDTPSIKKVSLLWLMPIFSVAMLILSMIVTNRVNGSAQAGAPGTGKVMIVVMAAFSAFTAFLWPAGFSLYWGMRSLIGIGQSMVLRKIANPEKIKQETLDRFNASKKARKELKRVKVTDKATGAVTEKTLTGDGLNKLRLQRAREADAEKYGQEIYAALDGGEYVGRPTPERKTKKDRKSKADDN